MDDPRGFTDPQLEEWASFNGGGHHFAAFGVRRLLGEKRQLLHEIAQVTHVLRELRHTLTAILAVSSKFQMENATMSNPTIDALKDEVSKVKTAIGSAVTYIKGVPALIQSAVDAATAGGASAADLAPVTQLIADLKSSEADLVASLTANTPTPPPPVTP